MKTAAWGVLFTTGILLATPVPGAQAQSLAESRLPATNWTSVYLGVHGGYAGADLDWRSNYRYGDAAERPTNFDSSSAIGGGHIGYMVQRGNWVFGSELSLSGGFDQAVNRDVDLFDGYAIGTMAAKLDYMIMSTTRVGYIWGKTHTYLKFGTAGALVSLSTDDNWSPNFGSTSWTSKARHFYTGWVFGAGAEMEIVPNLLLGVEYSYVTLDGRHWTDIVEEGGGVLDRYRSKIDLDMHTVMARLSYKMDAPVLATLMPF